MKKNRIAQYDVGNELWMVFAKCKVLKLDFVISRFYLTLLIDQTVE